MKFIDTGLSGAYVVEPLLVKDDRGEFFRTYCRNEFGRIGHSKEFVQFNHSANRKKGTLRGLHFQTPPYAEIKLVRCTAGRIFDVIVDIRAGSPTFLKWFGIELSVQNRRSIYIPEGFAHGFQTLEDDAALAYHHTEYYMPSHEGGLNPLDPRLKITWPVEPAICSDRDRGFPLITDAFKGH